MTTTTASRAHLSSATDNWPTPQDFYDRLDAEFGFVLDVCASTGNAKTDAFYALDHRDPTLRDGLAQDWAADAARLGGAVWMNPPYGRPIGAWMAKAVQAARAGATVVTLVPVRADTQWWHEHVLAAGAKVRYVRGRLTFGAATNTAAFASAVVIYAPTDVPGAPGPVASMPAVATSPVGTATGGPVHTVDEVTAKVHKYVPRSMTPQRWAQCADAVRDAVLAARPRTRGTAQVLLSALVAYLNSPCGWDGATVPNLSELLTEARITQATSAMPHRAGRRLASQVRMVSRAIGASDKPARITTPRELPCEPFIADAACRPVPVVDLVRAWQHATGKGFTVRPLEPVAADLVRRGVIAVTMSPEGSLWEAGAIAALVEAADHEVTMASTKRTTSAANGNSPAAKETTPGKPKSRRAALAQAKAAARAAGAAGASPAATVVAPAPEVADDILAVVKSFEPTPRNRAAWDANRDLAVRLVLGYCPPSVKQASHVASVIATFLAWWTACPARTVTGPVTFDEVADPATLELWMRLASRPMTSRATMRSVVRRCVRSLDPDAAPSKVAYAKVSDPYTPDEMTKWRFYAANQPTPTATARLSFIVGLCAGAGLDSGDLRHLRARDIFTAHPDTDAPVLMVAVSNAHRSRTVPVRSAYAPLVTKALELHRELGRSDDDLLLGKVADRNNVVWNDARIARTATTPKVLQVARLRNTWLVAVMSAPVGLADVLRASGLYTARTLTDLLDHCPPTDDDTLARVLADLATDVTNGNDR
ncbi:DNA N-6-adenine-methyltransferase [Janibacter sp. G368]|uniref:DNA N-6-adenine-methyltransferase n=1 Tax=Janibacter sp. G368 TaxID=3420441 RepID=UPI003D01DAB0